MNRTWEFTDLEFVVLWERYIDDHIPKPLTFTSRTPLLDDYEREKFEAWERLQATAPTWLRTALEVLARPQILVKVLGWYDRNTEDPQRWIRARVACSGNHGYILTQRPGETIRHSGGYKITECGPRSLGEAIVKTLPKVEAGRFGDIPIVTSAADVLEQIHSSGSMVLESGGESAVHRSNRFFDTAATRTGVIILHQGQSKFGPRGILEQILIWRDLPDDGRYVIELGSAPTAIGIGTRRLAAKLDMMIEDMLERVENHWESSA
ncbi:ESX secretion-associated protein EspG [Nocardia arthritidis]|uniref:ESX secretion-associated protein EspG n=1 Tax=Nocardia arthritidis TaxID=228602 RepID=A0A6G9Y793_9NOCA|nr:ESX secretion-associated protein EspG [Nocardia arthritidis]QIS08957.1 hypothetical protein F5544_05225 [Nocardia arthritidis]